MSRPEEDQNQTRLSIEQARKLVKALLFTPWVKKSLIDLPLVGKIYPKWERNHPFDIAYKIETSGFVPVEKIHADKALAALICPYGPSQPQTIRKALNAVGEVSDYTFVDLGCGKGRATVVATEFNFKSILGVELSSDLSQIARANAAVVARDYPQRTPIQIAEANVVEYTYPSGKVVFFIYHAFGLELLSELIQQLEDRLSSDPAHTFVVYYNAVHGNVLDASPAFERWYAESIPCDLSEIAYGPESSDIVVIWQSKAGARETPHARPDREIRMNHQWQAALAD